MGEANRGGTPLWLTRERTRFADACGDADVVVIGGGVAGIAAAYHASRAGLSVLVLETARVASRASGRNDGQILLGLGEHLNRIVGQWGRAAALELWRFLDTNHRQLIACIHDHRIECSLVQHGGMRLAETEQEARELGESAALMAEARIDHRLLDAATLARELEVARGWHAGLFLPREAIFDPAAFVEGLARLARSSGALIREGETATAIEGELGDFTVHTAGGLTVAARVVVHATAALAPDLDRSGFLGRSVFPFRGQLLATEPLPPDLLARIPLWAMSSNFCYEYFRVHGDRLTLGGMRWSVPGEESGITDDTTVHPAIRQRLLDYLGAHFPALAATRVEREWTGIMAGTRDGLPLVGALPGRPGEYACLAFNGYGMSFAYLAGLCIADMIAAGRARFAAAKMFRPDRFGG